MTSASSGLLGTTATTTTTGVTAASTGTSNGLVLASATTTTNAGSASTATGSGFVIDGSSTVATVGSGGTRRVETVSQHILTWIMKRETDVAIATASQPYHMDPGISLMDWTRKLRGKEASITLAKEHPSLGTSVTETRMEGHSHAQCVRSKVYRKHVDKRFITIM